MRLFCRRVFSFCCAETNYLVRPGQLLIIGRYLVIGLALLGVGSCFRGDDPTQESATATVVTGTLTPEIQASATVFQPTPSATAVMPTPTRLPAPSSSPSPTANAIVVVPTLTPVPPTPTPVVILPELALDLAEINQCRISGDLAKSGFSGQGTAPAPTVTPVPKDRSRDVDLVAEELAAFRVEVDPIATALNKFNGAFHDAWSYADTAEKQAAQLHVFGNRLAQLCLAASQLKFPPEAIGETIGLGESIRARHAWIGVAFDELQLNGDARTEFMDIGLALTNSAIVKSTSGLNDLLAQYLTGSKIDSNRTVINERFGLKMTIGPDDVIARNTVDLLVTFNTDFEILEPSSLGPESWREGAAIRIRRLRNGSEMSVSQAIEMYGSLLARIGEVNRDLDRDVPGLNGIQLSYRSLADSWGGSVIVFVRDDFTYFVESLCPRSEPGLCETVEASVNSIQLLK